MQVEGQNAESTAELAVLSTFTVDFVGLLGFPAASSEAGGGGVCCKVGMVGLVGHFTPPIY